MQVYSDAIRACCGNTSDGMVDGFETDVEVGEERNALPGGRGYATSDEGHAIGLETQGSTARVPTVGVESAGLEFIAGQAPLRRALDVFAEVRFGTIRFDPTSQSCLSSILVPEVKR